MKSYFIAGILFFSSTMALAEAKVNLDTRESDQRYSGTFIGQDDSGKSCQLTITLNEDQLHAVVPGNLLTLGLAMKFETYHANPTVYDPVLKQNVFAEKGFGMDAHLAWNTNLTLENMLLRLDAIYPKGSTEPTSFTVIKPATHHYRIQGVKDRMIVDCRNLVREK